VSLERLHGVAIVSGHEHHRRHRIGADSLQHVQTAQSAQLDVQEEHVGGMCQDRLDCRRAVSALRHDIGIGQARELLPQRQPARGLVIDQNDPHLSSTPGTGAQP
jgi:hypothetical protein